MNKTASFDFDINWHNRRLDNEEVIGRFLVYGFKGDMSFFKEDEECNEFMDMISNAEQYGVLDCCYSPDKDYFGYNSYEIRNEDIPKVIKFFTDYFKKYNVDMVLISDKTGNYEELYDEREKR